MINDINYSLECRFPVLLNFVNSSVEISRVTRLNKNISRALYPLTENFLKNYYSSTNYSNLKKTFKNGNCAADVYSYFVMSYGFVNGTGSNSGASGANSSGLNPFGLVNADLGFNLGGLSWLWWLAIGFVVYKVVKK